ncbi:unannotated protein [freshwater metagenome]|uniref:Unannotated protein n=1 Tax=freshwater metagenome TaxID=449393 RepID=A0A6J6JN45_9ZZZZ
MVLGAGCNDYVALWIIFEALPIEALDGKVVALGSSRGKNDLATVGRKHRGKCLSRCFKGVSSILAKLMNRRRITYRQQGL